MRRPHRTTHARFWLVFGPLLLIAIGAALLLRPPWTPEPAETAAQSGQQQP